MTQADLNYFRRRLLALKKRLGGVLSQLEEETLRPVGGEASGGLSNIPVDMADLGNDNYEEEVSIGLLENEHQMFVEIDDALDRIEKGTFGRCEACGQSIPRKRLDVQPYARYCLQCAEKLQQRAGKG